MSMKSTEVRNLAAALAAEVALASAQARARRRAAAEANDLSRALVNGRLRHTCGAAPAAAATVDCNACGVAEDKRFERLADR